MSFSFPGSYQVPSTVHTALCTTSCIFYGDVRYTVFLFSPWVLPCSVCFVCVRFVLFGFLSGDDASQNTQSEDNFFEKARRCVLRAIGVGATKSLTGAGVDGVAADATLFPASADDIEAKHKIKVRQLGLTFCFVKGRSSRLCTLGVSGCLPALGILGCLPFLNIPGYLPA